MERIAVILAWVLFMAPLASGAAYVKYEGVDGEATGSADHKDEIDVLSWSWGMHRDEDGTLHLEDFHMTKQMDASSATLQSHAQSGRPLDTVVAGARDGTLDYLVITMEDAVVSSYRLHSDGDRPTEEVAFYYNKITFSVPQADGSLDQTLVFTGLE